MYLTLLKILFCFVLILALLQMYNIDKKFVGHIENIAECQLNDYKTNTFGQKLQEKQGEIHHKEEVS